MFNAYYYEKKLKQIKEEELKQLKENLQSKKKLGTNSYLNSI